MTEAGQNYEIHDSSTYIVNCGWDDVPHLTEEFKAHLLKNTPPYLRDARSKGIPSLSEGAIYPLEESEITYSPTFRIPRHWPKAYGMDVGWNRTACVWGAWDRDQDVVYLFSEHYRGMASPSDHATAIKARGGWMRGAIDPASRARNQQNGEQLLKDYRDLGLKLLPAKNSREAGLQTVWERMCTGRLKVSQALTHWLTEYRVYRRDKRGRVVKQNDHLMDATRYLIVELAKVAGTEPVKGTKNKFSSPAFGV